MNGSDRCNVSLMNWNHEYISAYTIGLKKSPNFYLMGNPKGHPKRLYTTCHPPPSIQAYTALEKPLFPLIYSQDSATGQWSP